MKSTKAINIYSVLVTILLVIIIIHEQIPNKIFKQLKHESPKPWKMEVTNTYTNSPHWEDRNSLFSHFNTTNKIVFVGNSITEYCNWNELFNSDKIINRGIAGDRSVGILRRIDFYLKDTPACIILMDGINDLTQGVSLDSTIYNYRMTIDKIKHSNIPLIVNSTLFIGEKFQNIHPEPDLNVKVASFNKALKAYCLKNEIEYVDINSVLSNGNYLNAIYTNDGTHLNGSAYMKWKEILGPHIKKFF